MPIWSAENTARPSVQQNLTPFDLKLEQDTLLKPINTQNRRAVYGLTVDDAHEYFANGVLVRNCDALRMFAVDYALPESTPKTIHEEVQERIDDKYKPKEGEIVTPEQQMSYMAAKEAAEDRVKQELGLIDEEDEDGY